jgi:hypothetical protein
MTERAFGVSAIQKNELYNNIKHIMKNCADNEEVVKELVQMFIKDLQERKLLMAETQSNPASIIEIPKGGSFRRAQ